MAFAPKGRLFFIGVGPIIHLWDSRTGRELWTLQKHNALITTLAVTPDGKTLIAGDASGLVLAWGLNYYDERMRRELTYRTSHPEW